MYRRVLRRRDYLPSYGVSTIRRLRKKDSRRRADSSITSSSGATGVRDGNRPRIPLNATSFAIEVPLGLTAGQYNWNPLQDIRCSTDAVQKPGGRKRLREHSD